MYLIFNTNSPISIKLSNIIFPDDETFFKNDGPKFVKISFFVNFLFYFIFKLLGDGPYYTLKKLKPKKG